MYARTYSTVQLWPRGQFVARGLCEEEVKFPSGRQYSKAFIEERG